VGHSGTPVQWGDVAAWVSGVAAVVALPLTYRSTRATRRQEKAAQAEKRQEQSAAEAEKRRAQARLVSAWCDHVTPASSSGYHTVTVKLQNSSDEPIYGVRAAVGATWFGDKISYAELRFENIIQPNCTLQQDVSLRLGRASDGSYEASQPEEASQSGENSLLVETSQPEEASLPVEVIFYDATRGGPWIRDRFGSLAQIKDSKSKGGDPGSVAAYFFRKPASPA
jgi:hypothetical protein